MSIELEFINFIVPIAKVREKYPGGWEKCLHDHAYSIGRYVWYDLHLFRSGAMGSIVIKSLLKEWENLGFHTHDVDGLGIPIKWVDVCVYDQFFGGATLPCDWIAYDDISGGVYLKGTDPGKLVSRDDFVPTDRRPSWTFK